MKKDQPEKSFQLNRSMWAIETIGLADSSAANELFKARASEKNTVGMRTFMAEDLRGFYCKSRGGLFIRKGTICRRAGDSRRPPAGIYGKHRANGSAWCPTSVASQFIRAKCFL